MLSRGQGPPLAIFFNLREVEFPSLETHPQRFGDRSNARTWLLQPFPPPGPKGASEVRPESPTIDASDLIQPKQKAVIFPPALKVLPKAFRDVFYDILAANRYRWFGKKDACMVADPDLRNRFLDMN